MFSGEESTRIESDLPREEMEDAVADALSTLGHVEFLGRTGFEIRARRLESAFANVIINGELTKGRKSGQWTLTVTYQVNPSALCWAIAILGFLFLLIGLLILLVPLGTKNNVQKMVARAVRAARNDIEDEIDDRREG
ncbi:unnamed protein product [Gemmata massiliana]|uniref:Uncharacterized protein n=1 Tax=Gemmata massiliana TaxID=1210884 RepID=A0A6P2CVP3_9BACT|nr:hypothetical protein [Gemmata massiliana]VTR93041.1 unnamed protein product [Gemmata massiliana]